MSENLPPPQDPDNRRRIRRSLNRMTRRKISEAELKEIMEKRLTYAGLFSTGLRLTISQFKNLLTLDFSVNSSNSSFGRNWLQTIQESREAGKLPITDEILLLILPGMLMGITNTVLNVKQPFLKKLSGYKRPDEK